MRSNSLPELFRKERPSALTRVTLGLVAMWPVKSAKCVVSSDTVTGLSSMPVMWLAPRRPGPGVGLVGVVGGGAEPQRRHDLVAACRADDGHVGTWLQQPERVRAIH